MIRIWRFDVVSGMTRGFWFQCWRQVLFSWKVIDVGCCPFFIAIYYRR